MPRVSLTTPEIEALIDAVIERDLENAVEREDAIQTIDIFERWDDDEGECGVTVTDYDQAMRQRDTLEREQTALAAVLSKLHTARQPKRSVPCPS